MTIDRNRGGLGTTRPTAGPRAVERLAPQAAGSRAEPKEPERPIPKNRPNPLGIAPAAEKTACSIEAMRNGGECEACQ